MSDTNSEHTGPHSTPPQRRYKCSWCGAVSDGTTLSCPACGATLDVRRIVTSSGWVRVPGRKDMAKLQLGKSHCQIEGLYVPVADFNLSAEDGVYFAHHVLLWKDNSVNVTMMSLKTAWKRLFAGMPIFMTQAQGPGHIAFSRDSPGELLALPLQPGHHIDVREHYFLVATRQIDYGWSNSNVWFTVRDGNETKTDYPMGMFLDHFAAEKTPGLLLIHTSGNVFVRTLSAGQSILIKPTAMVFKDSTVSMQLHFEFPRTSHAAISYWGAPLKYTQRYLWLNVSGPGRIAIQSAYEPVEDSGGMITTHSPATRQMW